MKGSFVTFDPANLEAIGNKHAVSDSVFKVTRNIEELEEKGSGFPGKAGVPDSSCKINSQTTFDYYRTLLSQ